MKKLIFVLIVWISLTSCEETHENPATFHTGFNQQILDGYFVKSIAFDQQGNAWVGTFKQGLIKYNPGETLVYTSENSVIPDTSVIHDIAIDSKNNVWIACEGLIKYDGKTFTHFNSTNTPIPEDFVSSIAIDAKDNVWFASSRFRQGGIVKYDGSDWTVYTPENSALPVNFVQSIIIDNNDDVWVALNEVVNDAYLVKISGDHWTTYTSDDLGFQPYYLGNIQVNSQNEVCGAIDYSLSSTMTNKRPQVFIFDGSTSEKLQYESTTHTALITKFITIDNQDNIWCGAFGGYAVYDGTHWTVDHTSFQEESVFAIEQSSDGKIWMGTGDGIYTNH